MKILLLSDPSNSHTVKWANALHERGIEVLLFGLSDYDPSPYLTGIRIESLKTPSSIKNKLNGNILKSVYLLKIPALKKVIKTFKPDLLHAHYAASYGLLGALSGFHPYLVSIWGIDIYIFPNVSTLHKNIIKYVLKKADGLSSTSGMMAAEAAKYTNRKIEVVPFGIDLNVLKPKQIVSKFSENDIVIGTVKHLEYKYGLTYLIKAFSLLVKKHTELPLKLLIVGGGSMESKLKDLCGELEIDQKVIFTGSVSHNEISDYHNMMNIEVYLSDYESFGVSIIEASACEKPVVVSNVGGMPEVVDDGKTGLIVPPKNPQRAAEAIEKLILNKDLSKKFGKAGREKVTQHYIWEKNVDSMIGIYKRLLKGNN